MGHTGRTVFVTGESVGAGTGNDYATVAYNAITGAQRWAARYDGGNRDADDIARSIAASPTADRVFVTGNSTNPTSGFYDFTTIAYRG